MKKSIILNSTVALMTLGFFQSNAFAGAQERINTRNTKITSLQAANSQDQLRLSNVSALENLTSKAENMSVQKGDGGKSAKAKCDAIDAANDFMKSTKTPSKAPFDGKGGSFQNRLTKALNSVKTAVGVGCKTVDIFVPDDTPVETP